MTENLDQLGPCPYTCDTCAICSRLYFSLDGSLNFERECRRYPSKDAQKQAIRKKFPDNIVSFFDEKPKRKKSDWKEGICVKCGGPQKIDPKSQKCWRCRQGKEPYLYVNFNPEKPYIPEVFSAKGKNKDESDSIREMRE